MNYFQQSHLDSNTCSDDQHLLQSKNVGSTIHQYSTIHHRMSNTCSLHRKIHLCLMTRSIHEFHNVLFNSTTTDSSSYHEVINWLTNHETINRVTLGGYHLGFWSGGLRHVCSKHTMECEQVVQSVERIHEVVGGESTKSLYGWTTGHRHDLHFPTP